MNIQNLINHSSTSAPQGHCQGFSFRTYPNGFAECSVWPESGDRKKYRGRKAESREEQSDASIQAAISRTKKNIRHNIMGMSGDRLFSLTFRRKETDIDIAWKVWKRFKQRLSRGGINFQYVVVAELQERGAIHFHFAANKYLNVNVLRYHWQKSIGDFIDEDGNKKSSGSLNVTSPRKGRNWQPYRLAVYLSKYIDKEMVAAFGKHRYRKSRGISKIIIDRTVLYMPRGLSCFHVDKIFKFITGANPTSIFTSEEGYQWICSWPTHMRCT
jgi:hypothetical protein